MSILPKHPKHSVFFPEVLHWKLIRMHQYNGPSPTLPIVDVQASNKALVKGKGILATSTVDNPPRHFMCPNPLPDRIIFNK